MRNITHYAENIESNALIYVLLTTSNAECESSITDHAPVVRWWHPLGIYLPWHATSEGTWGKFQGKVNCFSDACARVAYTLLCKTFTSHNKKESLVWTKAWLYTQKLHTHAHITNQARTWQRCASVQWPDQAQTSRIVTNWGLDESWQSKTSQIVTKWGDVRTIIKSSTNLMEMPLASSTRPCAALCTGLMDMSAHFTSHTCVCMNMWECAWVYMSVHALMSVAPVWACVCLCICVHDWACVCMCVCAQ